MKFIYLVVILYLFSCQSEASKKREKHIQETRAEIDSLDSLIQIFDSTKRVKNSFYMNA